MTTITITIPPEAVEAAAVQLSNGKNTTQAIAAAVNAWPGVSEIVVGINRGSIILPMPPKGESDD